MADDLFYQINNTMELSLFYFGDESFLTANLRCFHHSIKAHIITFRAAQLHLLSFAAEFAYVIDTRMFHWLKMCRDAADRSQVDNTLVNFDTLF